MTDSIEIVVFPVDPMGSMGLLSNPSPLKESQNVSTRFHWTLGFVHWNLVESIGQVWLLEQTACWWQLCCWFFPNVLWLASQLLLRHWWTQEWQPSIRLYHQSQCNHFHSPHQRCFYCHCCRLHRCHRYHCLASKSSFSASSLCLNPVCSRSVTSGLMWRSQCLVITWTLSVLVLFRCFSSLWCLRYLFSSGTQSFFYFYRIFTQIFPSIIFIIFLLRVLTFLCPLLCPLFLFEIYHIEMHFFK